MRRFSVTSPHATCAFVYACVCGGQKESDAHFVAVIRDIGHRRSGEYLCGCRSRDGNIIIIQGMNPQRDTCLALSRSVALMIELSPNA
jgi:hypothetical protein